MDKSGQQQVPLLFYQASNMLPSLADAPILYYF